MNTMPISKKYHKKIEEGFKYIFKTETKTGGFNGLSTIVEEPIVKHQIIQLAKLCREVPASVSLKKTSLGVVIEFW